MLLKDILTDKAFQIGLSASNKEGIVQEIATFFEKTYGLDNKTVFTALWSREQKGSTGLGKALAIPHARIPNLGSMKLAVFYVADGKDFEAYDKIPTQLFFAAMIDTEGQPQEQLEMLKIIVETCENTDLMTALKEAHTATELKDIVIRRITEVQNG